MGFSITYHRFFVVRVKEQNSPEPFRYLDFNPTAATTALLRDYQLIFRSRENGFDVYYKTNEYAKPKLQTPIGQRLKFTFTIKVNSPALFSLYEPDAPVSPQFYLDNLTSSGAISTAAAGNLTAAGYFKEEDMAKIYPQTFRVETKQNRPNAPKEWYIKEYFSPNKLLQTVLIDNPDSRDTIPVKLNDPEKNSADHIEKKGVFMLDTDSGFPEPSTIYLDDELSGQDIQGILDLYWGSSQDSVAADTGKVFQIIFKRK